jgi:transcriptional regulator with XRE-family HTH domain
LSFQTFAQNLEVVFVKTDRIRKVAKERGRSLSWVCSKVGVHRGYFLNVEKDDRSIPADKLEIIASCLETTVDYLTYRTDDSSTTRSPSNVRSRVSPIHKNEKQQDSQSGECSSVNYDRLEALADGKGVSKTFLCQIVGKERYYLRDCKKNSVAPPVEFIKAWADALGTTVEYLTDETDDPSPKEKEPVQALSEEEELVLQILRTMSIEQKLNLIEYLKGM